jgi:hypothetical protein
VQQEAPAQRAVTVLRLEQSQRGRVHRQGRSLAAPIDPVGRERGVVWRRPSRDQLVPDDLRPGELPEVGTTVVVAEYPSVLPGLVEPAEVPVDDPALRLVRVATCRPLVGELEHVVVQRGEGLAGHHRPVVGRPAAHDRVDRPQHRRWVRPSQGLELAAEPFPDPSERRRARLDQQLPVVAADVEPQEVEPVVSVDDACLVLVERQTSGRQPCGQTRFDLFGLFAAVAHHDEVVCVSHQRGAARLHPTGVPAGLHVADPSGLFHPVQCHVKQRWADHPALRSALFGRSEPTLIDHPGPQPSLNPVPGGEQAQ